MKTAVSFYSFDQNVDIREACEHAKKAGYQGVELTVSEGGQLNMKTSEKEMLEIRKMINDKGLQCDVEVDGGVAPSTAEVCIEAGANVLVAGSSVFKAPDREARIKELRG